MKPRRAPEFKRYPLEEFKMPSNYIAALMAFSLLVPTVVLGADAEKKAEVSYDGATEESMKLAKTLLTLLGEVQKNGKQTAKLSVDSYRIRGGVRSIAELRFDDQIIAIDLHEDVVGEDHVFVYRVEPRDSFFQSAGANPPINADAAR